MSGDDDTARVGSVELWNLSVSAFLDTAPVGYLAVEATGRRVVYVNDTWCRVAGSDRSEVLGRDAVSLFGPASAATIAALLAYSPDADTSTPVGASADLRTGPTTVLAVLATANRINVGGTDLIQLTVQNAAAQQLRERRLTVARNEAVSAHADVTRALSRSQDALGVSEDARKSAEAERSEVQLLASTLQRTLLPPILSAPPGIDVSAFYHHASTEDVGGDFYDVFPLDAGTWAFFLGDVSGKGAGAAAVTSLTRYAIRAAAVFDRDPIAVLTNLNSVLLQEFRDGSPRFCTVIYGTMTPSDDGSVAVTLASGGHPPALHLRGDGEAEYVDTLGGQLVGILDEPRFRSRSLVLDAGHVLLMYTDGLTEARTGSGRARYDDDGALEAFARSAAPTTAAAIIDRTRALLDTLGPGVEDDVALLALGAPHRTTQKTTAEPRHTHGDRTEEE
ncbi:PP2C family protein-serine/threonine phosphatase [Rhodococcoides kroppenstedtii]|uniref:PP2C family protein-serine/threonine phosphatase n=1 Tax=Rhodococcoides kroppenstedtii TaxID=293050 RepID=UPI0028EE00E0|nr:SpoIIE family protein phosphatase [Rhodococcus kroppenstedtii]